MSGLGDSREGLSPSPPNILDLFAGEDDSDVDFQPSEEHSTTDAGGENENDSDTDFLDAQESLGGIEIVFEDGEEDEDEDEGQQTETEVPAGATRLTYADLRGLLQRNSPLRQILLSQYRVINPQGHALFADADDDDEYGHYGRRRGRRAPGPRGEKYPKVPNEHGQALMNSGNYGTNDDHVDIRWKRRKTLSERLMWRRLGVNPRSSMRRQNSLIAQELIPDNTMADKIIHYDSRAYSGQFSDDGNFFFSCTQNFKVRMYDTSNPYEWQYYKTVDYPFGQWTITDATLSPDNRFLAYSSIRHAVCLATTDPSDASTDHNILDFTNFAAGSSMGRQTYGYMGRHGFGIWSLRFSGDGREIVAGTSDHSVVVFDLERRQSIVRLSNHDDDVNAVCYGDRLSPHILYSGSDDQTLRVWDRRSMADGRPAGVFVGHTEGLTYVDSKGDGRYVLSNGKDQTMKLWDLRKMISPNDFNKINLHNYTTNFDYRFTPYDEDDYIPNPHDCSVVTFRGHSVLKTLIRCHFSPPSSSNSRYVYSGSEDGKVWIWNLDGTVKGTINVGEATRHSRPRTGGLSEHYGYELHGGGSNAWRTCVRDASWSPTAPVMAATSWNGWGMATGTVSLHSFSDGLEDDEGLPPMSSNYNARLDLRDDFNHSAQASRTARRIANRTAGPRTVASEGLGARVLRSRVVRANNEAGENDDDDTPRVPGGW